MDSLLEKLHAWQDGVRVQSLISFVYWVDRISVLYCALGWLLVTCMKEGAVHSHRRTAYQCQERRNGLALPLVLVVLAVRASVLPFQRGRCWYNQARIPLCRACREAMTHPWPEVLAIAHSCLVVRKTAESQLAMAQCRLSPARNPER